MEMAIKKSNARIEKQTNLIVPHNSEELIFAYPQIGPNTYSNVGKEILKQRLSVPTGDYTASLIHTAYCDEEINSELEFQNIREIMKNRWLWVFNRNLWTDKGVYVLPDFKVAGLSEIPNLKSLEKRLEKRLKNGQDINGIRFSEDKRVRFAPKELYKLGMHTSNSLSKDGFILASFGKEGAEKIGEVSSKFKCGHMTYGLNISEGENPIQRVSALYRNLGPHVGWVWFGGDFVDNKLGVAFGVCK